jgi:hypothetical protein
MRTRGLAGADDANIGGMLECVIANGIPNIFRVTRSDGLNAVVVEDIITLRSCDFC